MEYTHQSIMTKETLHFLSYLSILNEPIFVDGTLGLAGHSISLVVEKKESKIKVIGIDKDATALKIAEKKIKEAGLVENFVLVHDDFHNINDILDNLSVKKIDGMLLDLGVSSMQLDDKSRGFSFSNPEIALDMRMDQSQSKSAFTVVNTYNQKRLEDVLKNGEEWHFRKIAAAIVSSRKTGPIVTVGDLLKVINAATSKKYSKTHPGTDTFRALRLEVNDEISRLAKTINHIVQILAPGGRLAIITFHSLEDRIVKNIFKQLADPCTCPAQLPKCICGKTPKVKVLTKKPITPSSDEIKINPRSRSAKLRVIEKL